MKFLVCFILLLLLFSSSLFAAPLDDNRAAGQQYDELRQQSGANSHQSVTDDADMVELYLAYAKKALAEGEAEAESAD